MKKNVSTKAVEKIETHILCSITPPSPSPSENGAVNEII